jgi:hypothetical protein
LIDFSENIAATFMNSWAFIKKRKFIYIIVFPCYSASNKDTSLILYYQQIWAAGLRRLYILFLGIYVALSYST